MNAKTQTALMKQLDYKAQRSHETALELIATLQRKLTALDAELRNGSTIHSVAAEVIPSRLVGELNMHLVARRDAKLMLAVISD